MMKSGLRNQAFDIEVLGFEAQAHVFYNLSETELCNMAVSRGEARLSAHGALVAMTGQHTGARPRTSSSSRRQDPRHGLVGQ